MAGATRGWDLVSDETRRATVQAVIDFFETERDERIGMVAAEELLDFFLQSLGLELYNRGIKDARAFLKPRFDDIEIDMEALLKK